MSKSQTSEFSDMGSIQVGEKTKAADLFTIQLKQNKITDFLKCDLAFLRPHPNWIS